MMPSVHVSRRGSVSVGAPQPVQWGAPMQVPQQRPQPQQQWGAPPPQSVAQFQQQRIPQPGMAHAQRALAVQPLPQQQWNAQPSYQQPSYQQPSYQQPAPQWQQQPAPQPQQQQRAAPLAQWQQPLSQQPVREQRSRRGEVDPTKAKKLSYAAELQQQIADKARRDAASREEYRSSGRAQISGGSSAPSVFGTIGRRRDGRSTAARVAQQEYRAPTLMAPRAGLHNPMELQNQLLQQQIMQLQAQRFSPQRAPTSFAAQAQQQAAATAQFVAPGATPWAQGQALAQPAAFDAATSSLSRRSMLVDPEEADRQVLAKQKEAGYMAELDRQVLENKRLKQEQKAREAAEDARIENKLLRERYELKLQHEGEAAKAKAKAEAKAKEEAAKAVQREADAKVVAKLAAQREQARAAQDEIKRLDRDRVELQRRFERERESEAERPIHPSKHGNAGMYDPSKFGQVRGAAALGLLTSPPRSQVQPVQPVQSPIAEAKTMLEAEASDVPTTVRVIGGIEFRTRETSPKKRGEPEEWTAHDKRSTTVYDVEQQAIGRSPKKRGEPEDWGGGGSGAASDVLAETVRHVAEQRRRVHQVDANQAPPSHQGDHMRQTTMDDFQGPSPPPQQRAQQRAQQRQRLRQRHEQQQQQQQQEQHQQQRMHRIADEVGRKRKHSPPPEKWTDSPTSNPNGPEHWKTVRRETTHLQQPQPLQEEEQPPPPQQQQQGTSWDPARRQVHADGSLRAREHWGEARHQVHDRDFLFEPQPAQQAPPPVQRASRPPPQPHSPPPPMPAEQHEAPEAEPQATPHWDDARQQVRADGSLGARVHWGEAREHIDTLPVDNAKAEAAVRWEQAQKRRETEAAHAHWGEAREQVHADGSLNARVHWGEARREAHHGAEPSDGAGGASMRTREHWGEARSQVARASEEAASLGARVHWGEARGKVGAIPEIERKVEAHAHWQSAQAQVHAPGSIDARAHWGAARTQVDVLPAKSRAADAKQSWQRAGASAKRGDVRRLGDAEAWSDLRNAVTGMDDALGVATHGVATSSQANELHPHSLLDELKLSSNEMQVRAHCVFVCSCVSLSVFFVDSYHFIFRLEMQADVKALAERYHVELPAGAFEEEDAARRWGRDAAESKWRGVRSAVNVTAALNEPRDPFAVLHRATEGLQEQIFSMVEERGWSEDFETHSDQLGHELSHASVKAQLAQPVAPFTAESFHRAVVAAQVKRPRGTVRTLLRPHGRWRERARAERQVVAAKLAHSVIAGSLVEGARRAMVRHNVHMGAVQVPMRGMGRLVGRVAERRRAALAKQYAGSIALAALSEGYAHAADKLELAKTHEVASIAGWIAQDASTHAMSAAREAERVVARVQRAVRAHGKAKAIVQLARLSRRSEGRSEEELAWAPRVAKVEVEFAGHTTTYVSPSRKRWQKIKTLSTAFDGTLLRPATPVTDVPEVTMEFTLGAEKYGATYHPASPVRPSSSSSSASAESVDALREAARDVRGALSVVRELERAHALAHAEGDAHLDGEHDEEAHVAPSWRSAGAKARNALRATRRAKKVKKVSAIQQRLAMAKANLAALEGRKEAARMRREMARESGDAKMARGKRTLRNALRATKKLSPKRPGWKLVGGVARSGLLKSTRERDAAKAKRRRAMTNVARTGLLRSTRERDDAAKAAAERRRLRAMRGAVTARGALERSRRHAALLLPAERASHRGAAYDGYGDGGAALISWTPPPDLAAPRVRGGKGGRRPRPRSREVFRGSAASPSPAATSRAADTGDDVDRIDAMDEFVASFAQRSYHPLSFADEVEAGQRSAVRRARTGASLESSDRPDVGASASRAQLQLVAQRHRPPSQPLQRSFSALVTTSSGLDIDAVLRRNTARLEALGVGGGAAATSARANAKAIADRAAEEIASPMPALSVAQSYNNEAELSMNGSSRWVPQLFE